MRCHEAEGGLRDVTILEVGCEMSRGPRPAYAERCREAEGGLRDVTILEVERCREAEGGLRDVTRPNVR